MGRIGRFLSGASFLFRGLSTLLKGGRIRRWAIAPLVLNALLFMLLLAFGVWAAVHYTGEATGDSWWGSLLQILAAFGAAAVMLTVTFFTFGMVAALAAAPFNELISQGTERILTRDTGEIRDRGFLSEMLRAGLSALKMFLLEMAVVIPAMFLLLIPVAGPLLFAVPAGFFMALTYMDYSLDRRKLGVGSKLSFCLKHLPEVMGFGVLVYACMLVPFVNVLTVPVAAVGGTRLFLSLKGDDPRGGPQLPSEAGAPPAPSAKGAPSSPGRTSSTPAPPGASNSASSS